MGSVVRLFDAQMRAKYAREHPRKPTGIIFEYAGVAFDLLPITYGQLLDITEILDKGAELMDGLKGVQGQNGQEETIVEIIKYIVGKAPTLILKVRDHLAKSPGVCDIGTEKDRKEDRARFEEWFRDQDAAEMTKAFFPYLKQIIGARPLATPTPAENEAGPSSEEMLLTTSTS